MMKIGDVAIPTIGSDVTRMTIAGKISVIEKKNREAETAIGTDGTTNIGEVMTIAAGETTNTVE